MYKSNIYDELRDRRRSRITDKELRTFAAFLAVMMILGALALVQKQRLNALQINQCVIPESDGLSHKRV